VSGLAKTVAKRVKAARAFVFDMDGTLVLGSATGGNYTPFPGAVDLLVALRARKTPFRVFTNGTAKPPAAYAAALREAGLDVRDEEFMTPASAAADWFVKKRIKRVRAMGNEGLHAPLREAGIEIIPPGAADGGAQAVMTAWYKDFSLADLERACKDIWAGAQLTTSSNVPFFATAGGRSIGHSFAINAAIRSLTGKKPRILGKPSADAYFAALHRMGLPADAAPQTVVVGDDPALEMRMARLTGALGIAMTTGIQTAKNFRDGPESDRPHAILDGLQPILEAL
jgi:HAD superfamily hydrolase (TIGR01450 family)